MKIIIRIYSILPKKMKILCEKIIKKLEKGEYRSHTLRKLYKDYYGIEVGIGTYGCFLQEKYKYIQFGNYTSIASGLEFFPRNHPKDYATMHPAFYNRELGFVKEDTIPYQKLRIGNDVWIGKNVMITNKCKYIGNGAIVGAGSVVTKSVEPYNIVAGNPARVIGKRFDDEIISKLEESRWYELEIEELMKYKKYVRTPESFANEVKKDRMNRE